VTEPQDTERYSLTLYISGASPRSIEAVETLRELIDTELPGQVDLEIVDVHDQPALLLRDQVFAAPTLVKRLPEPLRRLVGNLSDTTRVRLGLGMDLGPVVDLDVDDET
jgi:circadian clock protein KaiB